MKTDVAIVGGGLVGSSVAFHLLRDGFDGAVTVVERDPSYQFASSALAMGGVRHQFTVPVSVEMVRYSARLYREWSDAGFRQRGYLFLADSGNEARLRRRHDVLRGMDVRVEWFDPSDIADRLPELQIDDLAGGLFGPEDGYVDPRRALRALRDRAEAAGARYVSDEVDGIEVAAGRSDGLRLSRAGRLEASRVVIATGAWTAKVAATAGVEMPITPVRQQLFRCRLPRVWEYEFPIVVDPGGVHWRSDTDNEIVVARTNPDEPPGIRFGCDIDRYHDEFLPALVHRVPAFCDLELDFGWGGLYEMTPDHNGIVGRSPEIEGLYWAAGFSGHGLMMAPATGKVMSELIRTGRYETVDATPLALERFARGEEIHDEAMI